MEAERPHYQANHEQSEISLETKEKEEESRPKSDRQSKDQSKTEENSDKTCERSSVLGLQGDLPKLRGTSLKMSSNCFLKMSTPLEVFQQVNLEGDNYDRCNIC